MSTDTIAKTVPRMGAEAGYGTDDTVPPLRVSGFICLILGLLSAAALVGPAALLLPIFSILFGVFALRRYGEQVPVGIGAAKVGMVLAVGFGTCGFFIPWMKSATLGAQAEQFALDYLEVVARDDTELALELRKNYVNRFPATMPLKAHYALNEASEKSMIEFRGESVNQKIRERGPGAEWALERSVRVFTHYQIQQAELVLVDPTGEDSTKLHMFLEYTVDSKGNGQWHVHSVQIYAEKLVAPIVL